MKHGFIWIRRVVGVSMMPTLRDGRTVVFTRKKVRVGDIVLALQSGREVVKRVTSMQDGRIYLAGDNRRQSTDSRHHGPVEIRDVKGVMLLPRR